MSFPFPIRYKPYTNQSRSRSNQILEIVSETVQPKPYQAIPDASPPINNSNSNYISCKCNTISNKNTHQL